MPLRSACSTSRPPLQVVIVAGVCPGFRNDVGRHLKSEKLRPVPRFGLSDCVDPGDAPQWGLDVLRRCRHLVPTSEGFAARIRGALFLPLPRGFGRQKSCPFIVAQPAS